MIKVHHLNNSRSQRILWLLEELGQDYEIISYQRDPRSMAAPASLRAVHLLGKSPVIEDGDAVIAESGAIVEHLLEHHGQGSFVAPSGGTALERHRFWLHFAEGSAMTPLLLKLYLGFLGAAAAPLMPRIEGQITALLAYLEGELADRPYFAGHEPGGADIMMSFPLEAAVARGGLDDAYPNLLAWLGRVRDRPAFRRALDRGGPFELGR